MIDVRKTITTSIKNRIDKMRFLAENDPKALKKILYLIVINDIYEWSFDFDTTDALRNRINEIRQRFIVNNPEIIVERFAETYTDSAGDTQVIVPLQPYVNVNTLQNNDTWKRVWDAPDDELTLVSTTIEPTEECVAWTPDYSCNPEVVYYTNKPTEEGEKVYGAPTDIEINRLTTCEKMNVYINRDDNTAWYLEEGSCTWKQLSGSTGITSDLALALIKANRQGITDSYANNTITHSLTETSTDVATMPTATDEEMEDLL